MPLSRIARAAQFKLTVELPGLQAANAWDFWVYPVQADLTVPEDVFVAHRFNGEAEEALSAGKKVLLLTAKNQPVGALENRFLPVFWSFSMFASQAGTLGIFCDPEHPALHGFPTDVHSNWQWKALAEGSHCFILDDTPPDFIPIVQVIDDFHRNHKLGAVIETRVGKGKLLACAFDLENDQGNRPAARHLLSSLLSYMGSKAFDPKAELEPYLLDELFKTPEPLSIAAGPVDGSGALLHVKAAALLETRNSNQPLKKERDSILAQADGFDYMVSGDGTWIDDGGSAWHGARLDVTVTCPKGFTGKLYIHFHDWNELDRRGRIRFESNAYTIGNHEADGIWAVFEMTEATTSDGRVRLEAERTAGPNLMITEIIVK
jgi:beta-galactosidase